LRETAGQARIAQEPFLFRDTLLNPIRSENLEYKEIIAASWRWLQLSSDWLAIRGMLVPRYAPQRDLGHMRRAVFSGILGV
jgi:hypothetical protein